MALDGAAARRRRRPRRLDPVAAGGLGGVGPPRELHRPAGRLPQLQASASAQDQLDDPDHVPELRRQGHLHRGPAVQPDVQDPRRPGRGRRAPWPTCAPRRRRACSSTSPTCCRRSRKKPPFGIAQIGKSFRNEITPGNFVFRTREFEQMEMEFFVPPDEAAQWYEYWCARAVRVVHRPRHPRGQAPPPRPRRRRAVATTRRAPPTSSSSSRGAGASSRASPTAATTTSPSTPRTRARSSSTSTRPPTSATCRT